MWPTNTKLVIGRSRDFLQKIVKDNENDRSQFAQSTFKLKFLSRQNCVNNFRTILQSCVKTLCLPPLKTSTSTRTMYDRTQTNNSRHWLIYYVYSNTKFNLTSRVSLILSLFRISKIASLTRYISLTPEESLWVMKTKTFDQLASCFEITGKINQNMEDGLRIIWTCKEESISTQIVYTGKPLWTPPLENLKPMIRPGLSFGKNHMAKGEIWNVLCW